MRTTVIIPSKLALEIFEEDTSSMSNIDYDIDEVLSTLVNYYPIPLESMPTIWERYGSKSDETILFEAMKKLYFHLGGYLSLITLNGEQVYQGLTKSNDIVLTAPLSSENNNSADIV